MKFISWLPVILQRTGLISPSPFPRRPVSLPTFPTPPTQPRPPRIPEQVEIAFKSSTTTKKKSFLEMLISSKGKSDLATKPSSPMIFAGSEHDLEDEPLNVLAALKSASNELMLSHPSSIVNTTTPQITFALDNDILRIVARIGKQTYKASIHRWSDYYRRTIPRNTLLSVKEQAVQECIAQAVQQSIAEKTHRSHVVASRTVPTLSDLTSLSRFEIIGDNPMTTETRVPGHETTLTSQHAERADTSEPPVDARPRPHPKAVVLVQAAPLAVGERVGATELDVVPQTTAHQESGVLPLTASNLSVELISKINKLINRLDREIKSHWPYPNKDLKLLKRNGLNELIDLAKTTSVQDALTKIKSKYPKISEGRISTRTADLLAEIDRFGQQKDRPMPR